MTNSFEAELEAIKQLRNMGAVHVKVGRVEATWTEPQDPQETLENPDPLWKTDTFPNWDENADEPDHVRTIRQYAENILP